MSAGEKTIEHLSVDANCILQAAVGGRSLLVFRHLEKQTSFHTTVNTFNEVLEYLPYLSSKQNISMEYALTTLDQLLIRIHPPDYFSETFHEAWTRIHKKDEDDVPLLALALKLNCPIWTNNIRHFLGSGVELYTTENLLKRLNIIS